MYSTKYTIHHYTKKVNQALLHLSTLVFHCWFQGIIARRSDMLVMSADGPISAYVNAFGHVHETLTLARARGLSLAGQPQTTANSWFPGLAELPFLGSISLSMSLG